jgi:hypothetical protein
MPTTYAIPNGAKQMNAVLYTGTGVLTTRTGLAFDTAPSLVWIKGRSGATDHVVEDSVSTTAFLRYPNLTNADGVTGGGWIQNFSTTGFSTDINVPINTNGATYVAWAWAGGGAAVTNTAGSITSQVSANTAAGFSVVTYTSTTGTVGHGLGVAPSMIIMKGRNVTDQWTVGHASINNGSSPWNYGLALNATSAQDANGGFWNNTAPTSTVFSQGSWDSGFTKVAYCFAAVPGYSAFGSYTGNGSADGTFVYLGFRPRFLLIKRTNNTGDWWMYDTSRSASNTASLVLYANSSAAEISDSNVDILSNGFKLRSATFQPNTSGGNFVYAAFAETPFAYSNAR